MGTIQNESVITHRETTYRIGVRERTSLAFRIDQLPVNCHLKVPRISDTPRDLCPRHLAPYRLRQGIITRGVPSSTTERKCVCVCVCVCVCRLHSHTFMSIQYNRG